MTHEGRLTLRTVEGEGLRFEASFDGHTFTLDSGGGAVAVSPPKALLGALAACEGMDVISILRKKRLRVTAYEIVVTGERAESHPRYFTRVEVLHRITGQAIPRTAVAEAIALSEEKYCSVRHTLRPDLELVNRIEVLEG